MIRRHILLGLTAGLALFGTTLPAMDTAASSAPTSSLSAPSEHEAKLLEASDLTAVYYDTALTREEILDRVPQDAASIGLPFLRTMIAGKLAIFQATPREVESRLRRAEGIPVVGIAPVLHPKGTKHPSLLTAITSKAVLSFHPRATEAQKEAYYAQMGFRRIQELPNGHVVVDTRQQPGLAMIGYLDEVAANSPIVLSADCDYVVNAKTQATSDAIQVEDPFFDEQWYLDGTRRNAFGFSGSADEDIDAPRAWMFNKRLIESSTGDTSTVFGSSQVVVGIFDTGIEYNHADLADTMDDRIGSDFIESGYPGPPSTLMGTHGTAMGGVIAAAKNEEGIVGIAPGTRLYGFRVLGEDYGSDMRDSSVFLPSNPSLDVGNFGSNLSTSSSAIVSAITESIFEDIDINLHSYSLGVDDLQTGFVANIDSLLRQSFESGRRGYGTTNIAAAGNYYSQVEYPASSFWTFAVGGVNSTGDRILQSNWGGLGIDFVMPSYAPADGNFEPGVLSTDLTGDPGIQGDDPFEPDNADGEYAANGPLPSFAPEVSGETFERFFGGTSYSAAMAAGVVALMYSDERYRYLPPLLYDPEIDVDYALLTRSNFRSRAPLSRIDSNILGALQNFADLPYYAVNSSQNLVAMYRNLYDQPELLNNLMFINQFNEMLGFGRPNASGILAADEGIPARDSGYEVYLYDEPIYSVRWNAETTSAPTGIMDPTTPEYMELAQGWTPIDGATVNAFYDFNDDGEAENMTISPYLEGVSEIYIEGESDPETAIEPAEPDAPYLIYAWTDSLTTSPEGSVELDVFQNFIYNPDGTYWAGRRVGMQSPLLDFSTTPSLEQGVPSDSPMVLTVYMAHELGNENAIQLNGLVGDPTQPFFEIDTIDVKMAISLAEGPPVEIILDQITGDSTSDPKAPLEPAIITEFEGPVIRPVFRGHGGVAGTEYRPLIDEDKFVVRSYRFLMPPLPAEATGYNVMIEMNPGNSFLPTWFIDTSQDPPTANQMFNIQRDNRGFLLYGVDVHAFKPALVDYLDIVNVELGGGFYPSWTASENDVLGVIPAGPPAGYLTRYAPDRFYVQDPSDPDGVSAPAIKAPKLLTRFEDQITGLKNHPFYEQVALTIDSPSGDGVYLISTDGVNLQEIVGGELAEGAREPNWSRNGIQLAYCSENSIHIINFIENFFGDFDYEVETILDEDSFLTDFHSPVFNEDSGLIFFTARLKESTGDDSLNLYMATRSGRVIGYLDEDSDGNPDPLLRGWEGVDLYDLDITFNGQRLILVANADAAPDVSEDGEIISPATSSMNTSMFALENIQNVAEYNQYPIYTQIVPSLFFSTGNDQSVRWPRVNPSMDEIAWVGFPTEMSVDSGALQGEIVRQPLPDRPGIPTPDPIEPRPTPDVTPTATPPIPSNAQVARVGEVNFVASEEGWRFNPGGFLGSERVVDSFELADTTVRRLEPGIAGFFAASTDRVERADTRVAEIQFQAQREGTATFTMLSQNTRITSAKDNLSINVPTVLNDDSPTTVGEARIWIEPSIINVSAGQVFTVKVRIDPNDQKVYGVEGYIGFSDDSGFLTLISGQVNRTVFDRLVGDGALVMRSPNTNSTFGYWESTTPDLRIVPDSLFLYRAQVSATAGTPDGMAPTVRLRVNTENLESVFGAVTNSTGDGTLVPVANEIKNMDLLFKPPASLFDLDEGRRNYLMSFDLINFLPGQIDPNGGLALHGIDLYRLDDQRKYRAVWGFFVPASAVPVTIHAVGLGGIDGNMTVSLRRCCELADTEVAAATGPAKTGVLLESNNLAFGNYTLVVSVENYQDILVTWDSPVVDLTGSSDDECPEGEELSYTTGPAADACETKAPIYGSGRNPDDPSEFLTSIQEPFYDPNGFFGNSELDTKETKSVIAATEPIFSADLSDEVERSTWTQGPEESPFGLPVFDETDDTLTLASPDRDGIFGYWNRGDITLPEGALETSDDSPVVIFRGTYRFIVRGDDLPPGVNFDPTSIPDIRPRLATNEFQRSVEGIYVSFKHGATAPAPGKPREMELYLVLEAVPENIESLIAAFDILAFYPEDLFSFREVTDIPMEMELVRIERVHIPSYPLP